MHRQSPALAMPSMPPTTPIERSKRAAESKVCFSCLSDGQSFQQCPQPIKCTKEGCKSSHNTLRHGSGRNLLHKRLGDVKTTGSSETKVNQEQTSIESFGKSSVTEVKGLLQKAEVELKSKSSLVKALALRNSKCSHSLNFRKLADKLHLKGSGTKLTAHRINTQ